LLRVPSELEEESLIESRLKKLIGAFAVERAGVRSWTITSTCWFD
jgi:hypothetical protein